MKFISLVIILLISHSLSAQRPRSIFDKDSAVIITHEEFDKILDSCIHFIQTKDMMKMSDREHTMVILCQNTIWFTRNESNQRRFVGSKYEELNLVMENKKYYQKIVKVYKDWIPSRGMGHYFPKLNIELGGTPHGYPYYTVLN